jgi:hypothetical protein
VADEVDRVQKLKDARSEAAKEIEEYKSKKEAEYKKFETDVRALSHLIIARMLLQMRAREEAGQMPRGGGAGCSTTFA